MEQSKQIILVPRDSPDIRLVPVERPPVSLVTSLPAGLKAGWEMIPRGIGGTLSMVGSGLGVRGLKQWGDALMGADEEEARQLTPHVTRLGDAFKSFHNFADWLGFTLGTVGPPGAASALGGLLGSIAGPAGTVAGAALGAGAVSFILNAGNLYADLRDEGFDKPAAAAIAGLPMALLDSVVPTKIAGKVLWTSAKEFAEEVTAGGLKQAGKEIGKSILIESQTEAAQEAIQAATEASVGAKKFMTPETVSQILNAMAAGAVGGGFFGAIGEAVPRRKPYVPDEIIDAEKLIKPPEVPEPEAEKVEEAVQLELPLTEEVREEVAEEPLPGTREVQVSEAKGPAQTIDLTKIPEGWGQDVSTGLTGLLLRKMEEVEGAELKVSVDRKQGILKLQDTGPGLSLAAFRGLLGEQGRALVPSIAWAKRLRAETVVEEVPGEKYRYTYEGFGQDAAVGFPFRPVKEERVGPETPTGTRIEIDLGGPAQGLLRGPANLASLSAKPPANIVIEAEGKPLVVQSEGRKVYYEGEIPGAKVTIYGSERLGHPTKPHLEYQVSDTGLWVQTLKFPYAAVEGSKLPAQVFVDVRPTVPANDYANPFVKDQLVGPTQSALEKLIGEHLVRPLTGKIEGYTPPVEMSFKGGKKLWVYPQDESLSEKDLQELVENQGLRRILSGIFDVSREILQRINEEALRSGFFTSTPPGWKTKNFGLLLAENTLGLNQSMPPPSYESGVFLNPFPPRVWERLTPEQAAASVLHTLKHELIHDVVPGHSEKFTQEFSSLEAALGSFSARAYKKLRRLYEQNWSDYSRALQRYRQAARRGVRPSRPAWGRVSSGVQWELAAPRKEGAVAGVREGRGRRSPTRQAWGDYINYLGELAEKPAERVLSGELGEAHKGKKFGSVITSLPPEVQDVFSFRQWHRKRLGTEPPKALREIPLPAIMAALDTLKTYRKLKVKVDKGRLMADFARFGWLQRNFYTLLQIGERYPQVEALQRYIALIRDGWWRERTQVMRRADQTLDLWLSLGTQRSQRVTEAWIEADALSEKLGRRLTNEEQGELALKHELDGDAFQVLQRIFKDFRDILDEVEKAALAEVDREVDITSKEGLIAAFDKKAEIRAQMEKLRNRHYFPHARFGPYRINVRAREPMVYEGRKVRTGDLVESLPYETETEMKRDLPKVLKRFSAKRFAVAETKIPEVARPYLGIPPALFDALAEDLNLSDPKKKAVLEILQLKYSPTQAFIKHFKARRGIAGFSQDAMRAYADYFLHGANFLAKLKYRHALQTATADIHRQAMDLQRSGLPATVVEQVYEYAEAHRQYVLNPGNELSAIRAGLFAYWFSFVPKQVVVNLSQLPMIAYPWLVGTRRETGIKADIRVAKAMAKAIKDVASAFKALRRGEAPSNLSPEENELMDWSADRGFVNESFASSVAGIASSHLLERLSIGHARRAKLLWRRLTEAGVLPFEVSEEFNRRVMDLVAYRLGREDGLSVAEAREYGRKAVDTTMFEYARWNRFKAAWGKKSAFFIFRTFMQHALYFGFTQPGRGRFWLMMLVLGGIKGLPFAEDLLEMISALGSLGKRLFGIEGDPRVSVENDLREMAKELELDPDTVMNGLSRSSFGLYNLAQLFGLPFPAMDFSSSIQLGRVLPIEPTARVIAEGSGDFGSWATQTAKQALGAGVQVSMDFMRAAVEDSPSALYRLKTLAPASIRQVAKSLEYAIKGEATDYRGRPLVKFDLTDFEHQAEIFGQLMGVAPRRLSRKLDQKWELREAMQFYQARREMLYNAMAAAIKGKSREARADVLKEIRRFNKNCPPGLQITGRDLRQSMKRRFEDRALEEKGLPTLRRYMQLYRNITALYPSE
ncbi:MAG: PLxRFG domain-containing protein [Deltaproteobacteria bacterium]|nr:PLxRFG domain-containing protein [Deltaproteobacteria bacterium]